MKPEQEKEKSILIIDDDANACRSLSFFLDSKGYRTIIAGDGEEGLKKFAENNPSLVLLDVLLPTTDGFEVCKQIKSRTDGEGVPVVLMSAYYSPDRITPSDKTNYGAAEYLVKPLAANKLLDLIETLTTERDAGASPVSLYSGNFRHISFAGLIGLLYTNRENGVLTLHSPEYIRRIYFIEGRPVFTRFKDFAAIMGDGEDSQQKITTISDLMLSTIEDLKSCFRMTEGSYAFKRNIDFIEDVPVFELNTEQIVFEGVLNSFPPTRFKPLMELIGEWKLQRTTEFDDVVNSMRLDESQMNVFDHIDGDKRIKDILRIDAQKRTFNFALLYTLIVLGGIDGRAD